MGLGENREMDEESEPPMTPIYADEERKLNEFISCLV
jgi:hypothetical protein